MGNNANKTIPLTEPELDEFQDITNFTGDEIINLYTHFRLFTQIDIDDGVIDYNEFCKALNIHQSMIA